MKRLIPALMLFIGVTFSATPSHALVDFKVDAMYWLTSLDANMTVTEAGVLGTDVDFIDDLGVDGDKAFPGGHIILGLGGHKLKYGFTSLSWSGSNTLSQPISYGGETFAAVANVESSLDVSYHRLGYEYDIIDTLGNRLGVILELKYFDIDGEISESALGKSATKSFGAAVPTIGVAAQVGLPFIFNVGGEITGISLGSFGYLVDAEAGINFSPFPLITLSAGYRLFNMHIEKDNDEIDLSLAGPYLLVKAGF